jgi:formate/nitrite transporter FocA (FNT family)
MAGPEPHAIWNSGIEEGKRRLDRGSAALVATGIVGGFDVLVGILIVCVGIGALGAVMPAEPAHFIASLFFGIAFVHIVLGRSELFTENFLIPVSAVLDRKKGVLSLGRLWALTLLGNLVALAILALIFSRAGVVPPETRTAAGKLANTVVDRDVLPALLSAIIAGIVMTTFTWMAAAAETDVARVIVALLIGFVLIAPSLNHAVVGFGEMTFGMASDETHATWSQLGYHFAIAVGGNLIGGLLFVASARLVQARGEPDSHAEPGGKAERDD